MVVQLDPCLLLLRLEELGYRGLSLNTVRRLVWDFPYPDPWHHDETENSLRGRFLPTAANSQ